MSKQTRLRAPYCMVVWTRPDSSISRLDETFFRWRQLLLVVAGPLLLPGCEWTQDVPYGMVRQQTNKSWAQSQPGRQGPPEPCLRLSFIRLAGGACSRSLVLGCLCLNVRRVSASVIAAKRPQRPFSIAPLSHRTAQMPPARCRAACCGKPSCHRFCPGLFHGGAPEPCRDAPSPLARAAEHLR